MLPLDRMLLVAAPSCCGKTTFINALRGGELDQAARALDFRESDGWLYKDAWYLDRRYLKALAEAEESNLVLHWTIPRPQLKLAIRRLLTGGAYDKPGRIRFVRSVAHLTVVTLLNSRAHLLRGVNARLETARARFRSGASTRSVLRRQERNMAILRDLYNDMGNVVPLYDRWFEFCDSLDAKAHHIVRLDQDAALVERDDWRDIRHEWLRSGQQTHG